MSTAVITHLIMGFLGTGKTTLLRHLLAHKPKQERWAILVNEFGEVGIDGALLSAQGAQIKEIPGGCLCCVSGVPFQIGLNTLLQQTKPDRLFIEPSGLGHPSQIINSLTAKHYQHVLQLGASFCVVDPRQWREPRYQEHATYQDQVALADVIVANKSDLASTDQLAQLSYDISQHLPTQEVVAVTQGALANLWLDTTHHPKRRASKPGAHQHNAPVDSLRPPAPRLSPSQPWRRYNNVGQGHYSIGWRFMAEVVFELSTLEVWCNAVSAQRLKAVVRVNEGWRAINKVGAQLVIYRLAPQAESKIELIHDKPLAVQQLQQQLLATVSVLP